LCGVLACGRKEGRKEGKNMSDPNDEKTMTSDLEALANRSLKNPNSQEALDEYLAELHATSERIEAMEEEDW
jgi:hypothetical protein